jgi:hypothetical protein
MSMTREGLKSPGDRCSWKSSVCGHLAAIWPGNEYYLTGESAAPSWQDCVPARLG